MKFVVKKQEVEIDEVEDGIYEGKLVDIQEREITTRDGQTRKVLRWRFNIWDEDEIKTVEGMTSDKVSTGRNPSKAYRWISVLLGREPEPEEEIHISKILNQKCMVIVENREVNGRQFPRVTDIKPLKKKSKKKAKDSEQTEE